MARKGLSRELIALRVAKELKDGMYVNLGFGLPTLACAFLPADVDVVLHSEQGLLGYGPMAADEVDWDPDLANASGQPVLARPGMCFTDLATSFGMVRGGYLDMCVLGAYQVSEQGDLANWQKQKQSTGAIGGAMELALGAKRVVVAMEHTTDTGEYKVVKHCTYPLTAPRVVNAIITNLAYIEVRPEGLVLKELAPGVSPEEVQEATEARLILSPELTEMEL